LVLTGTFFWASFDIREPDYGVLSPAAWPRTILAVLALLSFVLLIQSLPATSATENEADGFERTADTAEMPTTVTGFFAYWRNPILCFIAFLVFLLTLPYLGMLVGGIAFVFLLLTLLGGIAPQKIVLHALIAVLSIGAMWSLFTFGLKVILPAGSLFDGRI
ncbi:MAG: tripartite tricarboxylate transporter TctB family protein, partial [Pseudomonadota bacterium]